MYNYAADWLLSRAAWLSEQYAPDYTPSNLLGDANFDGEVDIIDATWIMRNDVGVITFSDEEKNVADVDRDGEADVIDATWIMRWSINIETPYAIGKPIR